MRVIGLQPIWYAWAIPSARVHPPCARRPNRHFVVDITRVLGPATRPRNFVVDVDTPRRYSYQPQDGAVPIRLPPRLAMPLHKHNKVASRAPLLLPPVRNRHPHVARHPPLNTVERT